MPVGRFTGKVLMVRLAGVVPAVGDTASQFTPLEVLVVTLKLSAALELPTDTNCAGGSAPPLVYVKVDGAALSVSSVPVPTLNVTGIFATSAALVWFITAMLPKYVPAARLVGEACTEMVAGVVVTVWLTMSQLPPELVVGFNVTEYPRLPMVRNCAAGMEPPG
jgi:hypothetical protein